MENSSEKYTGMITFFVSCKYSTVLDKAVNDVNKLLYSSHDMVDLQCSSYQKLLRQVTLPNMGVMTKYSFAGIAYACS